MNSLVHVSQVPTSDLGHDLTFGYCRIFQNSDVSIEAVPFAKGGYGNIFRCTLLGSKKAAVAKVSENLCGFLGGF